MKPFVPVKFVLRQIKPEKQPTHSVLAIDKDGFGLEYGRFWSKAEAKGYSNLHNTLISIGLKKSEKTS